MSSRTLKILLAASVALNLVALAAGATATLWVRSVQTRIEAADRPSRERPPVMALVAEVDPDVRQRVQETLRESARAARPDFDEARLRRREAIALVRSPDFDPAQARTLLEQSRAAELRGRARLESDAVGLLETLEADDRAALAPILTRRGRSAARGPRPEGPAGRNARS